MGGRIVNPQDSASQLESIVNDSQALISDRFEAALSYGDGAMSACEAFLSTLSSLANTVGYLVPNIPFLAPTPFSYLFNPGDAPVAPALDFNLPALPSAPVLETVAIEPQAVPSFDGVAPEISFPEPPSADLPNPPSDIPEVSPIEMPTKPTFELPNVPTFIPVTIPDVPIGNFPTFDAEAPEDNLVVPALIMGIRNDTYDSAIKRALQDKILDMILNGGTGLNPAVENDIWRREEERARLALEEAKEKIAAEWSERGFPLPDGVLVATLTQAETEYMNKRLDMSREIAIKQAELAFQATQFFIQQGIGLENMLINFANAVAQRTFESTRALQEAMIAIFNASVAKYNAELEAYKTKAAVYEATIRGEIGKAEFYKAQVAGAQATADVNRAYADLYRIQIAGIEELIKMYATEMEASKIRADIDRSRIDLFKAQIEGYVARIQAKTAEFGLHQARLDGEKAKVQIFTAQVDAFSKRVDAAKTEGSIKIEEARAKVESNRNLITAYSADLEGYKAHIQALAEKMNATLKSYETAGNIFRSKVDAQASIAGVDVRAHEAAMQVLTSQAQLSLKEAEVLMNSYAHSAQLKIEAAKGGAAVAAQLAAGIFSGVSVQAHISAAAQASKNYSGQESLNESHQYQYQPSTTP